MCGIKIVLALGLLLATVYARPEGYGVKGGKPYRATANAAASAHASANAGSEGLGIAQSYASATASADATAGGTSNAAAEATANAFADGENIGKAISSATAIANANPIGGSDDLGQSNDRGKDTEYKTAIHQDGTPAWNHQIANTGHGGLGNNENSVPGTVGVTNSATVCNSGGLYCRNLKNKPSVSNPHPTYNEHPDLSADSSRPSPKLSGDYGGNAANPESRPCTSGTFKCSGSQPGDSNADQSYHEHVEISAGSKNPIQKPSVSNPHPTYNEHSDLSVGSSKPLPNLDGGWGGNTGNPGSRPCTSGSPKCSGRQPGVSNVDQLHQEHVDLPADSGRPMNKPSVSNPNPTYKEHPDLSVGSSQPLPNLDSGWEGNTGNPGSRSCTSGTSKCSGSQPGDSNADQSYHEHVELPAGSKNPIQKPSVSNPHPTYNKHPDLSVDSSQPLPNLDGGWGGNTANPESRPCTSGTSKCPGSQPGVSNVDQAHKEHVELPAGSGWPMNKPSVSNLHPTYNEHPDLTAGSSQPLPNLDGGSGGNTANPESRPCISGTSKCSGSQPGVSNADESHPEHVELPVGSGWPMKKPSVSNPHPTHNEHPDLTAGSSQPLLNPDSGYEGYNPIKPTGATDGVKGGRQHNNPSVSNTHTKHHENSKSRPCTSSEVTQCSTGEPTVLNSHPTYEKKPDTYAGSSQPLPNLDGGCGGNTANLGSWPCNSGSSGSKPETSNPFLNGEIDVLEIQKSVKLGGSSPGSSAVKPNPSNPFLNPHDGHVQPSVGTYHTENPNGSNEAGLHTQYPKIEPNPSNPSNPFLHPHIQHPSPSAGDTHHSEIPNGSNEAGPSTQYPKIKPNPSNPSNPFLNPHSQHASTSAGSTHHSKNPNGSNKVGPSTQYPQNQRNPLNPFLSHHGYDDTGASSPASCKHKGPDADNDAHHSVTDEFGIEITSSTPSYGVKAHRPGVKGGSARRPHSSMLTKYDVSEPGNEAMADGNASWDAYSKAHAVASSSAGGESSANAKSQAYSSASASGSSWSSSSVSASAFAF